MKKETQFRWPLFEFVSDAKYEAESFVSVCDEENISPAIQVRSDSASNSFVTRDLEYLSHEFCVGEALSVDFGQPDQVDALITRLTGDHPLMITLTSPDGEDTLLSHLTSMPNQERRIHIASYRGSSETALVLIRKFPKLYIGIDGVCTFKNASRIRDLIFDAPIERLLLESNYPAVKPNIPDGLFETNSNKGVSPLPDHCNSFVLYVAQQVALVKQLPIESVLEITCTNLKDCYF